MRRAILALILACGAITSAPAQVSVSIGINMPVYPQLVRVPNYPVYYAPGLSANYFFYDGMYWVYASDGWYASSWYNGPWSLIGPEAVPLFVLRIPVRYYRQPPVYFRGWRPDAPPRWGERWGHGWEQQRRGWDHWNRRAAPAPAPLPVYQRRYSGSRYPAPEQQHALQTQNYRYQPHDAAVRQRVQQAAPPAPPPRGPAVGVPVRPAPPHERAEQRPAPPHSEVPAAPARGGPVMTRPTPPPREHQEAPHAARPAERVAPPPPPPHQSPVARPEPAAARPVQRGPAPGAPAPQERSERGQGQGQERERGEGRGQDRKN